MATDSPGVFLHIVDKPSVKFKQLTTEEASSTVAAVQGPEVMIVDTDCCDPFILYLQSGTLPTDKVKRQQLEVRARAYLFVEGELDRRGGPIVLMKCVSMTDGQSLLQEIHNGIYGNHAPAKTLVAKAFWQGFYWPTVVNDATDVVRKCEGCQFFARQSHVLAQELRMIPMTWLFTTWGFDIVGPFKKAPGGFMHLFVVIDKFSKWVQAEAITKTMTQ